MFTQGPSHLRASFCNISFMMLVFFLLCFLGHSLIRASPIQIMSLISCLANHSPPTWRVLRPSRSRCRCSGTSSALFLTRVHKIADIANQMVQAGTSAQPAIFTFHRTLRFDTTKRKFLTRTAIDGRSQARRQLCGIRVYSMTMSGTCATHVLTKANPKAVWSRRLRCMQVSLCWWSVNCCVQACKQTQRDTQGTKRAKCAHVGDTNNTPPHANRESGVIQTSNRARVWQIWEAREDTWKISLVQRPCRASDSSSSSRSRCTAECANSIFAPKKGRF